MNLENVTLEDCKEMYEKKNQYSVVENGNVKGFKDEKNAD